MSPSAEGVGEPRAPLEPIDLTRVRSPHGSSAPEGACAVAEASPAHPADAAVASPPARPPARATKGRRGRTARLAGADACRDGAAAAPGHRVRVGSYGSARPGEHLGDDEEPLGHTRRQAFHHARRRRCAGPSRPSSAWVPPCEGGPPAAAHAPGAVRAQPRAPSASLISGPRGLLWHGAFGHLIQEHAVPAPLERVGHLLGPLLGLEGTDTDAVVRP
jgi:hypothetical protein